MKLKRFRRCGGRVKGIPRLACPPFISLSNASMLSGVCLSHGRRNAEIFSVSSVTSEAFPNNAADSYSVENSFSIWQVSSTQATQTRGFRLSAPVFFPCPGAMGVNGVLNAYNGDWNAAWVRIQKQDRHYRIPAFISTASANRALISLSFLRIRSTSLIPPLNSITI